MRPAGGTWQAPIDLSAEGATASGPSVAFDASGNAVAAWSRRDGTQSIAQASERPAGGAWQTPVDISAPRRYAGPVNLAVDPRGNAVAVWQQHSNGFGDSSIQSAARPAGEGWQAPVDLSGTRAIALGPSVAVDGQGNAVAVWVRLNGRNRIVQSATRPIAGRWQTPADLPGADRSRGLPSVAVDRRGNAVAVWQRSDNVMKVMRGAVRPAGGAWRMAVDISAPSRYAGYPSVAVDRRGNAVALWRRNNGSHNIVQAARRPTGGPWQAPVNLSAPGRHSDPGAVSFDVRGNAIAVWTRYKHPTSVVQSAARPAGGKWRKAVDVSAAGGQPGLAVDARGNAVAVWTRFDGINSIVQSAVSTGGGSAAPPAPTITAVEIYSYGVGTIVATCDYRVVVRYRGRLPGGHVFLLHRRDGAAHNASFPPLASNPMTITFLGGVPFAGSNYDFQVTLADSRGAHVGTPVTTSPFQAAGCPNQGTPIASYRMSYR